ncbi:MAG: hypothetical protein SGBAC_011537 [Bacillariaceae sp.]
MVDCKAFSEKRFKCHRVYGKMGEDCLNEELSEKRCLSLHHCPKQAKQYYGDSSMSLSQDDGQAPSHMSQKAICASWAEAFAYANTAKELEYGTVVIEHHEKAREIVNKDKVLKRECRDIAFALAQCLRHKKLV